jgi:hypothetical protein
MLASVHAIPKEGGKGDETGASDLELPGAHQGNPRHHPQRSINLIEVILRHGGEAQSARDAFAGLSLPSLHALLTFLNSFIIFPPDDTASNLDPGDRAAGAFPQFRHGSIKLTVLFNKPTIVE